MLGRINKAFRSSTETIASESDAHPPQSADSAPDLPLELRGLPTRETSTESPHGSTSSQQNDDAVQESRAEMALANQAEPRRNIEQIQETADVAPSATPNVPAAPRRRFGQAPFLNERAVSDAPIADRLYYRGFGITSVTHAVTPFHSTTKSAEPVFSPPFQPTRAPETTVLPALAVESQSSPRVRPPSSGVLAELSRSELLRNVFCDRAAAVQRVPGNAGDADLDELLDELGHIQVRVGLDNPQIMLVGMTLRECFGESSKDCKVALVTLRGMNLVGKLRHATDATGPSETDDVADREDKAWRLAQKLVNVPGGAGINLLEKLSSPENHPTDVHSSVADKERVILRSLLVASAHLTMTAQRRGQNLRNDPASLFSSPYLNLGRAIAASGEGGWPGRNGAPTPSEIPLSLAEKALLAAKEELLELDQHVGSPVTRSRPFERGTHGCRFALSMMRSNMPTDEDRNSDGTRSEFSQVEGRTRKTAQHHLNRALKKPHGLNRIKQALLDHLRPNSNKSPFKAYNKLVADGAGGVTITPGRNAGMTLSHRSPIADGRAYSDMIGTLEAAIDTHLRSSDGMGSGHGPVYGEDNRVDCLRLTGQDGTTLLQLLARSAILKTTRAETRLMPRFARPQGLSPAAQERAVGEVLSQIRAPGDDFNMDTLRAVTAEVVARENEPLSASRLLAWGAALGGPADAEMANRIAEGASDTTPEWAIFAKGFNRIEAGVAQRLHTPSVEGMSRHDAAELVASLVEREELGSGFALSNGGNVQASTKSVSGIVSSVLLGLTSSIRVDLGGGRIRLVTFESSTTTDRSALRMGVVSLKRLQAGVGGSVGHTFGQHAPVTLSAGLDGGYAYQITDQEGAVFGFPRHISGGVAGDREINAQKAKLVRMLLDDHDGTALPKPGNPEDRNSLIKKAYQAFGDRISIGRYESKTTDHIGTIDVTGGAGVRFGDFRLGLPNARLTGLGQVTKVDYREHSGWLKNEKITATRNYKLSVGGVLTSLNGLIGAADGNIKGFVQFAVGNGASESADFFHYRETDLHSSILSDGQELPTSFATRSYSNPAAFVASLANHINDLADDKSRQFFADQYGDEGSRQRVVENEKKAIGEMVEQYLREKDLTATPQIYWEFGDHNNTANRLRAVRHLAEKTGDDTLKKRASSELDELHTDLRFREGRFLINTKLRSRVDDSGVNGILGISYSARNQFTEQSISFT